MELTNKVAIVTGAGRGVGAAVAHALAKAGARVAVNDLNPDRAAKVAAEITASGGQAIPVQGDVANKFQCVKVVEATREAWGQLDILVSNAAITPKATILKMDEWEFQRCLEVNLKGTFFMSQLCGRVMAEENQARGGGMIIHIASTAGVEHALEGGAAYCASQAAVVGFGRECAREFAQYGIGVHTVLRNELEEEEKRVGQVVAGVLAAVGG